MHQDQEPRFNVRTGKIALLPAYLREELNARITDGQRSEQLLPWLNGLPQVRQLLAEQFGGQPILRQNLSAWVCGGYQDWLRARQQAADTHKLAEYTLERAKATGSSLTVVAAELAAGMLVDLLGQMSRAFGGGAQKAAGCSTLAALMDAFGPVGGGSDQSSVISYQLSGNSPGAGASPTDHRSLITDNLPLPSPPAGKAPGNAQAAEREQHALAQRVALLSRVIAGLTQLRKREQADEAMKLKRERLKQTGEMVELQRERLKLQARMHEDRLNCQKNKSRNPLDRPKGGGLSKEGLLAIEKNLKIM